MKPICNLTRISYGSLDGVVDLLKENPRILKITTIADDKFTCHTSYHLSGLVLIELQYAYLSISVTFTVTPNGDLHIKEYNREFDEEEKELIEDALSQVLAIGDIDLEFIVEEATQ